MPSLLLVQSTLIHPLPQSHTYRYAELSLFLYIHFVACQPDCNLPRLLDQQVDLAVWNRQNQMHSTSTFPLSSHLCSNLSSAIVLEMNPCRLADPLQNKLMLLNPSLHTVYCAHPKLMVRKLKAQARQWARGHCWAKQLLNHSPLIQVRLLVGSKTPVDPSVFIDSEADTEFIDNEFVNKQLGLNLESVPNPLHVRALDNNFLNRITHMTESVHLILSGNHHKQSCFQTFNSPHLPLILVHTWLHSSYWLGGYWVPYKLHVYLYIYIHTYIYTYTHTFVINIM